MPRKLRWNLKKVLQTGPVLECVASSLLLRERCAHAGFEAETESGWLFSLFGFVEHGWVRVKDDDGRWKILDPTLMLVAKHEGRTNEDWFEFCLGSHFNRCIPVSGPFDEQLASHTCGGVEIASELYIQARPK